MTVSPEKETGTGDVRPPARSRSGSWLIWIGVAVIAGLALAMFGFAADEGTDADPTDEPAVVITDDPGNDLGN